MHAEYAESCLAITLQIPEPAKLLELFHIFILGLDTNANTLLSLVSNCKLSHHEHGGCRRPLISA